MLKLNKLSEKTHSVDYLQKQAINNLLQYFSWNKNCVTEYDIFTNSTGIILMHVLQTTKYEKYCSVQFSTGTERIQWFYVYPRLPRGSKSLTYGMCNFNPNIRQTSKFNAYLSFKFSSYISPTNHCYWEWNVCLNINICKYLFWN